jgi:hypothetical protein
MKFPARIVYLCKTRIDFRDSCGFCWSSPFDGEREVLKSKYILDEVLVETVDDNKPFTVKLLGMFSDRFLLP